MFAPMSFSLSVMTGGTMYVPGTPFPIPDFRHVLTVLPDVALVVDQLVSNDLGEISGARAQTRHPIDDVFDQMKAIDVVAHRHVEGRGGGSFFLVPTNVKVVMVGSPIRQLMDQGRISVEGEDDGFVLGEKDLEVLVAQAMRMLTLW